MNPNPDNRTRKLLLLTALLVCAAAFAALAIKTRLDERDRLLQSLDSAALLQTVGLPSQAEPTQPAQSQPTQPPQPTQTQPTQSTQLTPTPTHPGPSLPAEEENVYILRTHKGWIAVFRPGHSEPEQVTDTRVAVLRRADQLLLRGGITVHGPEALAQLLEDFSY